MQTIKIPWTRAFWSWLVDGTTTGGTHEECTRCGLGRVSSTFSVGHRRQTPLGIPWRLLRTLLDHRSREPVPLLYVEVVVAGAVVGILLKVFLGVPWWLLPPAALAATWLYFLLSAFSRPRRGSLERDVSIALQPSRAMELYDAESEKAFREASFPLLGLDASWTGDRWLGGFATANIQVSELISATAARLPTGASSGWSSVSKFPSAHRQALEARMSP